MAGTGEINCLRRLRYSYGMYNQMVRYGTHVATHMSLGLLFLGGGRFTLGNSDAAVACMIAAFFPRFAQVSFDNKSYLQALRHLWVLAVEPRCLVARDVDTKEIVYLPVKIKVKDGSGLGAAQLISPTLVPDFDKLLSIRVDTPRYWPFYLDLQNVARHKEALLRTQTIFVKRRTAFLSYLEDPKGSRSLFVRSGSSTGDAATLDFPRLTDTKPHPASDLTQFISSFANDTLFLAFADHFCREDGYTGAEKLFHSYCHASLLDAILQDKPQTLQSHILLYFYRTMAHPSRYFNLRLQDLRFAADFYGKIFDRRFSGRSEGNPRAPLVREATLSGTLYALDTKLEPVHHSAEFLQILGRYSRGELGAELISTQWAQWLGWYLLRNSVPVSTLLIVLRELGQHAYDTCLAIPPPDGTADAATLERGIRAVLHATGAGMTTTLGSGWSARSLEEIVGTWGLGPLGGVSS
jgi:anaphase-promoting complex subunit 1